MVSTRTGSPLAVATTARTSCAMHIPLSSQPDRRTVPTHDPTMPPTPYRRPRDQRRPRRTRPPQRPVDRPHRRRQGRDLRRPLGAAGGRGPVGPRRGRPPRGPVGRGRPGVRPPAHGARRRVRHRPHRHRAGRPGLRRHRRRPRRRPPRHGARQGGGLAPRRARSWRPPVGRGRPGRPRAGRGRPVRRPGRPRRQRHDLRRPRHRGGRGRRRGRHARPRRLLVTGFQVRPGGYGPDRLDRDASAAGLHLVDRWATWDRAPWSEGDDYQVSVHVLRTGLRVVGAAPVG